MVRSAACCLAPVRNGLEILRLSSDGDTRTAGVREIMERQLVTMTRLIDDLLDISRISLGKVELKREAVTVSSILEGALEVSRPSMQLGRHELTVTTPDSSLLLHADSTRLAQVVEICCRMRPSTRRTEGISRWCRHATATMS